MKTTLTHKVVVMVALSIGAACGADREPASAETSRPIRVRVASVVESRRSLGDEVVGTVRARNTTAISSSVMGTVRSLRVGLGSVVREGDILAQLSAGEIEAKANQARALLAQAKLNLDRSEQLRATRSVSTAQYDAVVAEYQVAQAAMQEANVMRSYLSIRAPIAGVVSAKQCDVGDLAVPGKPLLVIESPGELRFEASIAEGAVTSLRQGEHVSVYIDAIHQQLDAVVAELSPSADPTSRTILVKFDLPPNPALRAGMFGKVLVTLGETKSVAVDQSAVLHRGQLELVFVANNGRAELRLIRAGRIHGGQVEILSGLTPSEQVVVEGQQQLTDGQRIEVTR